MTGDVIGGVGTQKNGSAFQVVVIAETTKRDLFQELFLVPLNHNLRHVSRKPARSDRVYLNIVDAPFARQVFRKGNDAAFAGVVTDRLKFRRRAANARDGGDVNNFTVALSDHEFAGGLR